MSDIAKIFDAPTVEPKTFVVSQKGELATFVFSREPGATMATLEITTPADGGCFTSRHDLTPVDLLALVLVLKKLAKEVVA